VVNLDIGVGSRLPVFCTALGKVVLAFLKKADQTRIIGKIKFERYTPFTTGSARELALELARIRNVGYALSDQELTEGLRSVAAPVFREGRVEGAFGISYALHRAQQDTGLDEVLIRQVLEIAKKVSF
jgi:IclR family pca regulon transcriptional regulator